MITNLEDILNKDLQIVSHCLSGVQAATSSNYGKFFTALRPYEVREVSEVHGTAGSSGSPVTLGIERLQGTEALGAGDSVLNAEFDLKGTANTVVTKKSTDLQNRILNVGDRLALEVTGTLTAVNDVQITVLLAPIGRGDYK